MATRKPEIRAFAEHLCEHCVLIRAGLATSKMYDDYDYAVAGLKNGDKLILKGMVAPKLPWWCFWRRTFSLAHAAAIGAVVKSLGLKPDFERAKKVRDR